MAYPTHGPEYHERDSWKVPCRAATTANITISTALNNGDTLDGVTLATGDRVLVKDQSAGAENGIYIVGASPARAVDFASSAEIVGAVVVVLEGTANADTTWMCTTNATITVGTTALVFAAMGGGSSSLDAIITASSGEDIADALAGAAAPDSGNVFATMADVSGGGAGTELDYVQITSNVAPTATTEGTANTVITGSAVAYDGSTVVIIEFFSETVRPSADAAARSLSLWLYDGSSSIGRIGLISRQGTTTDAMGVPCHVIRRLTPSNATHTYSIRASVNAGTGLVSAGTGVITAPPPAFIRITEV